MPARDKRHVVVIFGRTHRRGELTRRYRIAIAISSAGGAPVISPDVQTIEDFLLGIKAGHVCIEGSDNSVVWGWKWEPEGETGQKR